MYCDHASNPLTKIPHVLHRYADVLAALGRLCLLQGDYEAGEDFLMRGLKAFEFVISVGTTFRSLSGEKPWAANPQGKNNLRRNVGQRN